MNTIAVCSILSKLTKAQSSINKYEPTSYYLGFERITEEKIVLSLIKRTYPEASRKLWITIEDIKYKPRVVIDPADCSEGCPVAYDGGCHPLREWGCRKHLVKKLMKYLEGEKVVLELPLE